jgi:hypothetical protein
MKVSMAHRKSSPIKRSLKKSKSEENYDRSRLMFRACCREQCGHAATVGNFYAAIAHLPPPVQLSAIIELFIDHVPHQAAGAAAVIGVEFH